MTRIVSTNPDSGPALMNVRHCGCCSEIGHTVTTCNNPALMTVLKNIKIIALYSHAYHGSSHFLKFCISNGELNMSARRTRMFMKIKLRITVPPEPDIISSVLYVNACAIPRLEAVAALTPDMLEIVNLELYNYYSETMRTGMTFAADHAAVDQLPNYNEERRICDQRQLRYYTNQVRQNTIEITRWRGRVEQFVSEQAVARARSLRLDRDITQARNITTDIQHSLALNEQELRSIRIRLGLNPNATAAVRTQPRRKFQMIETVLKIMITETTTSAVECVTPDVPTPTLISVENVLIASTEPPSVTEGATSALVTCPICWSDDVTHDNCVTPGCNHTICYVCIKTYLNKLEANQLPRCSICRTKIVKLEFNDGNKYTRFNSKYK